MPLSGSVAASQLADNCVVELVVAMSAPVPSRTLAGPTGGVEVRYLYCLPVGIRGAAGQSDAVDGYDTEVIGLPHAQRQTGLRHRGHVAQRGPIDEFACRRP